MLGFSADNARTLMQKHYSQLLKKRIKFINKRIKEACKNNEFYIYAMIELPLSKEIFEHYDSLGYSTRIVSNPLTKKDSSIQIKISWNFINEKEA